jgi:hypothetical protein
MRAASGIDEHDSDLTEGEEEEEEYYSLRAHRRYTLYSQEEAELAEYGHARDGDAAGLICESDGSEDDQSTENLRQCVPPPPHSSLASAPLLWGTRGGEGLADFVGVSHCGGGEKRRKVNSPSLPGNHGGAASSAGPSISAAQRRSDKSDGLPVASAHENRSRPPEATPKVGSASDAQASKSFLRPDPYCKASAPSSYPPAAGDARLGVRLTSCMGHSS